MARRAGLLATRRRRAVAAAAALTLLALAAGAVALLAPGIENAKRLDAAASQRSRDAVIASLVSRAAADQRLQLGRGHTRDAGSGTPAATRLKARSALVGSLQDAVAADARARVRAGTLTGPVLYVTCYAYPRGAVPADGELARAVGDYACIAVNRPVRSAKQTVGVFGDPFWARIDFPHGRLAWCKINPRPGEGAAGTGPPPVALAPACDLERQAPTALPARP